MLMRFLWNLYGISMVLLSDVFAIAIGFLLDSCGISMICLWCFYWITGFPWGSLVFWWDCYGIPLGLPWCVFLIFLWVSFVISMGLPRGSYKNSIGLSWGFYGTFMAFLSYSSFFWFSIGFSWGFSWISMPFLEDFYGVPVRFPWYVYDISMGLLWDLYGIAMGVLWYFDGIPMPSFLAFP